MRVSSDPFVLFGPQVTNVTDRLDKALEEINLRVKNLRAQIDVFNDRKAELESMRKELTSLHNVWSAFNRVAIKNRWEHRPFMNLGVSGMGSVYMQIPLYITHVGYPGSDPDKLQRAPASVLLLEVTAPFGYSNVRMWDRERWLKYYSPTGLIRNNKRPTADDFYDMRYPHPTVLQSGRPCWGVLFVEGRRAVNLDTKVNKLLSGISTDKNAEDFIALIIDYVTQTRAAVSTATHRGLPTQPLSERVVSARLKKERERKKSEQAEILKAAAPVGGVGEVGSAQAVAGPVTTIHRGGNLTEAPLTSGDTSVRYVQLDSTRGSSATVAGDVSNSVDTVPDLGADVILREDGEG